MGRRREPGITTAAAAPARDHIALPRFAQIHYLLAGRFVVHHRPDRHFDFDARAFGAGPIAALAVPASTCLVLGIEAELQQRVVLRTGVQNDIAATSAISPAGTAAWDVLLP